MGWICQPIFSTMSRLGSLGLFIVPVDWLELGALDFQETKTGQPTRKPRGPTPKRFRLSLAGGFWP